MIQTGRRFQVQGTPDVQKEHGMQIHVSAVFHPMNIFADQIITAASKIAHNVQKGTEQVDIVILIPKEIVIDHARLIVHPKVALIMPHAHITRHLPVGRNIMVLSVMRRHLRVVWIIHVMTDIKAHLHPVLSKHALCAIMEQLQIMRRVHVIEVIICPAMYVHSAQMAVKPMVGQRR